MSDRNVCLNYPSWWTKPIWAEYYDSAAWTLNTQAYLAQLIDNQQRQLPILAVWVTNMIALPTQAGEKTKTLAEHNTSAAWHQTYKPTLPS